MAAKAKPDLAIEGVFLDPTSGVPLNRQLYASIRDMILNGVLRGGAKMPSSRALSERLGVSRFTTVAALDQLAAEGYLRAIHGSGTYVEEALSRERANSKREQFGHVAPAGQQITSIISTRAKALTWRNSIVSNATSNYLHMSAPDHRLFPANTWARLTKEVYANCDTVLASYRDTDAPSLLETKIAEQIAGSRGITCEPEEVVTTFGAHHAVNLLTELLLDPGDAVAFEEPGMAAIRSVFQSHGCNVQSMLVDEAGANPWSLERSKIKLAFLTAAKQQPLTIAMPARRKLEVLNWAAENRTIIVEDDLGSEFRYHGRPIPPLKAMDRANQVIYIGAFSMSLLQTLRVGYMIMPKALAKMCRQLIQVRYRATPQLTEQVVARFIQDGHYSRHLHRMRREYARRQDHLLEILKSEFSQVFVSPERTSGFYSLCYFLDENVDEGLLLARCRDRGLGLEQLSYYYSRPQTEKKALLVGFAASTPDEISIGCQLLKECTASVTPSVRFQRPR